MGRSHQHATVSERAIHDQTNLLPRPQLIVVFTALSLTLLIAFIDQNGISVSLPTIAADLNAEDTISWAGTTSLVANTMFQMLYGRLSDIFGRKAVYLTAIATLIIADILCGVAQNAASFYVFRGLAGIGGGGITNLSMIIISDIVTLEQRGKYQGIIGAMVGLGNVAGPFLGAAFIQKTGSWRGFFYMLAPLGAVVWVITFFLLPSKPPSGSFQENARKVDYMGSVTSSVGVIFLLIPISGGMFFRCWDSSTFPRFLHLPCSHINFHHHRRRIFPMGVSNGYQYACNRLFSHDSIYHHRMEARQTPNDAMCVSPFL